MVLSPTTNINDDIYGFEHFISTFCLTEELRSLNAIGPCANELILYYLSLLNVHRKLSGATFGSFNIGNVINI